MKAKDQNQWLLSLTARVIIAYVSNNRIPVFQLDEFIASVGDSLSDCLGNETAGESQQPAVPIGKSITPDYIISLEDGRMFRSLKQHLRSAYGMSPDDYRAKWNLPPDYPMVAPSYSAARSALSKNYGFGTRKTRKPRPKKRKKN